MESVKYNFRDPLPEDLSFIYNSWLKGYRERSAWASAIPSQIYFSNHKKVLAKILQESCAIMAVNPDYPEQIFGYVVYQPTKENVTLIHYVYVKYPYRRLGIASALIENASYSSFHDQQVPMVATHNMDIGWDHLSDKWNVIYNPYVLGAEFFYDTKTKSIKAC